ncbi:MAG: SLBB domain-containing protein [Planctomycetaceae bacterium]|nr:SLBB domain-containing protein [Planctomycetaceae bacterium]
MRGRHLTAACFLLLTSLCFTSQLARAGQPGEGQRSQRTQTWQEKVNSPGWVAIVGEVARPGTYETATTSSSLRDLLGRAGGVTEEASGNLQVIRRGRPGQHLFLSPNAEHPVYNGDVVVVEGRRNRGIGTGIELRNGRRVEQKPESGKNVWVAFVRLLERPVVVQIPAEIATPEGIVEGLKQPPELAARLEIISTASQPRHRATGPRQIANGSVIVFPETGIDYSRISSLPAAYRLHNAAVAETAPAAETGQNPAPTLSAPAPAPVPAAQSAIDIRQAAGEETVLNPNPPGDSRVEMLPGPPEDLGQSALVPALPATSRDASPEAGLRRRVLQGVEALPAPQDGPMYADNSREPARPSVSAAGSAPGRPGPVTGPALAGAATGADWLERITPSGPGTSGTGSSSPADQNTKNDTKVANLDEDTLSEAGTWSASTLVILTFGTLLSLGTFIVLWSMSGESETTGSQQPSATAAAPLQRDAGLEALIQNRVPLSVEPVVLPTSMEFYGRPQGTLKLRLEAGHATPASGPHFATRTAGATKQQVTRTTATSAGNSPSPGEGPIDDAAVPASSAGQTAESTRTHVAADGSGSVYRMDAAESTVPRPRSMAGTRSPGSRRAGLLDRVLATVHGASQK